MFAQPNKYFAYYFSATYLYYHKTYSIYTHILGPALKHNIKFFNRTCIHYEIYRNMFVITHSCAFVTLTEYQDQQNNDKPFKFIYTHTHTRTVLIIYMNFQRIRL